MLKTEGSEPFEWDTLVPLLTHPTRVAIVESLRWIGEPLSASDLRELFERQLTLQVISYHLLTLVQAEAIVEVRQRQLHGFIEKLYFFS